MAGYHRPLASWIGVVFSITLILLFIDLIMAFTPTTRPSLRVLVPRTLTKPMKTHLYAEYGSADLTNKYKNLKFTILGGGAFSLAMVKVLADHNIATTLLVRNQSIADHINTYHYHPKYLSDLKMPVSVNATTDPVEALQNANYVLHAVPMQSSRDFLKKMKPYLSPKVPILSVTKGVEIGTFSLMNDILVETLGDDMRTAFLSGPSFAKEIVMGKPTAVVIASSDDSLSSELSEILSSNTFRCHTSRDVKGVELGGAIKNVIALAAGMCEGLDLGMNAMSSLVTRGCVEMAL
jgi:glycerol-3-phosphate dehydrogenase (NAD+)